MSVAEGHGIASNQRRLAEWEARLARWRTPGTSIRQFCLDEVVCEPSFYLKRKRVLRAGSQFDDGWQSETPRSRRGAARVPGLSLGRAKLYEIEKMIKRELAQSETTMSTEDQYRFIASRRQKLAVPVLTEFRKWMDGPLPGVLPKSLLSKSLDYVQNQWDALMRYVEDGRLQPDNNTAERALHGIALGRNAWLFCGSANGGQTAATHFPLIASAVRNGLEPYQYLSCLLEELPLLGDKPTREQLLPYMPNVWRPYNGNSSL